MKQEPSYSEQLRKVMVEKYKGVYLRNVFGRWMYGIKSFDTKEELIKFIDEIKK